MPRNRARRAANAASPCALLCFLLTLRVCSVCSFFVAFFLILTLAFFAVRSFVMVLPICARTDFSATGTSPCFVILRIFFFVPLSAFRSAVFM